MRHLSRRSIIHAGLAGAGLGAIPFPEWFAKNAAAQGPLVRYDAQSANGQQMLRRYAEAVAKMKSVDQKLPMSWQFQWYTHWIPGSGAIEPNKSAAIQRVYGNQQSPNRTLAQQMWDTCQPHAPGSNAQADSMFLPWHRMYVYFFERIVRKIAGTAGGAPPFTLPYWNYTRQGSASIPPEFRMMNDPNFKSLYVGNRNTVAGNPNQGVNQGTPIDQVGGLPLNLASLQQGSFLPLSRAQQGFCNVLDNGLHGAVHVDVGTPTNMGDVPTAAQDPVFWMHHSNIDRLWASWNRAGRANPATQPWLTAQFVFADENGARVVATVRDFADIQALNYTYDSFEPVPPPLPPPPVAVAAAAIGPVAGAGAVTLGAAPTRVELTSPAAAMAVPSPLGARLAAGRRLYLVLGKLQAAAQPGVLYGVYLDLPSGTAPDPAGPHYVGALNFFGAAGHGGHGGETARSQSYDVTETARKLAAANLLGARHTVTIAPARPPRATAGAVVGEIALLEE
jgi:tyrosinase